MDINQIKSVAYSLSVMLGEMQNEVNKGEKSVELTASEINEMAGYATEINEYFENN